MLGNNNQTQETEVTQTYAVKVERVKAVKEHVFAFDMVVNGVTIFGCWYREGVKDGKEWSLISFPSRKAENDKYYNYCQFPISSTLKAEIVKQMESLLGG